MDKPKRTIYKIKYEVEIEITEELHKTRRGDRFAYKPEVEISEGVRTIDFDRNSNVETVARCEHLEKHLPAQIIDSVAILFYLEGRLLNVPYADVKSKIRLETLEATKGMVNQRQAQRLPALAGRNRDKSKKNYLDNKNQFISDCVEILKNLRNEDDRLTQQKLADIYFTDKFRTDQKKPLLAKLKLYEISWKDLVAKIPNKLT